MDWRFVALFAVAPIVLLLAARRLRRPASLPLTDAARLARPQRRSSSARAVLAFGVACLLGSTAALSTRPVDALPDLVPEGRSTVVVLDVSSSVGDIVFGEIANTLRGLVEAEGSSGRLGLILFSDAALEALPPGTRAAELEPFIRYFEPLHERGLRVRPTQYAGGGPGAPSPIRYPINPWFGSFSGGTRISTGLVAAREALEREAGGSGRVLLISDLAEADEDRGRLAQELLRFARESAIDLRIVALPPATDADLELYRRLLGRDDAVVSSFSLERRSRALAVLGLGFPSWLAGLVVALAAALAAYELAVVPLRWRRAGAQTGAS